MSMHKECILLISLALLLCGCESRHSRSAGSRSKPASQRQERGCPHPRARPGPEKIADVGIRAPITLALDWFPEPDYAGVFYAKELGLFEKAGVTVEIVEGQGSNLSAADVGAGKYPLAFCSGGATVLSFNKSTNLVSLAVLYPRVSTVAFGLASEQIKTIDDLRGKRVGIYPGSINNDEWAAFLLANGLKANEFATVVPISGSDLQLLKAKEVDAVLNYAAMSPTLLELDPAVPEVDGKKTFAFPLADHGVKGYGLNLVSSREALRTEGGVLRRVAAAICDGYRQGCANPDAAVRAFCKRFPEKNPVYVKRGWAKVCAMIHSQAPVGRQTEAGWQETINTYRSLGLLRKEVQPASLLP